MSCCRSEPGGFLGYDWLFRPDNELAKANYEKLVTGGREVSELTVKLAEQVAAPISARMNIAVERISKPLAA